MIYIYSINKHISDEEFKEYLPQKGDVVKFNESCIGKCVSTDQYIEFDTISFVSNDNDFQLTKSSSPTSIASLDVVNDIISGKIEKIDSVIWDVVVQASYRYIQYLNDFIADCARKSQNL